MNLTIGELLDLYEKGTIAVLSGGQVHFKKQKKEAVRQQPNDSSTLKNNYELIIPRFF